MAGQTVVKKKRLARGSTGSPRGLPWEFFESSTQLHLAPKVMEWRARIEGLVVDRSSGVTTLYILPHPCSIRTDSKLHVRPESFLIQKRKSETLYDSYDLENFPFTSPPRCCIKPDDKSTEYVISCQSAPPVKALAAKPT
jgi:hypothetical protein